MRSRICLTRKDAVKFLKQGSAKWSNKTLIYLDPPYYVKGRELYHDFYKPEDHTKVADAVRENLSGQKWIVSYDNVAAIRSLYANVRHVTYDIGYSARSARKGSEVMFFCDGLKGPPGLGMMSLSTDQSKILFGK